MSYKLSLPETKYMNKNTDEINNFINKMSFIFLRNTEQI